MAINCHTLNWSTGVVLDSAALIELLGDDIFFSLFDMMNKTVIGCANSESCPDLTKEFTNLSRPLYLRKKGKRYISQLILLIRNLKWHMDETTEEKGNFVSRRRKLRII